MARPKEPISLLQAKGRSHLGKAEIEERKNTEVKAGTDSIKPPTHLSKTQKKEFVKISKELINCSIMTNLDVEALARYVVVKEREIRYREMLDKIPAIQLYLDDIDKASRIYDRAFKECSQLEHVLGLDILSRGRLATPKAAAPKKNKFDKFDKAGNG